VRDTDWVLCVAGVISSVTPEVSPLTGNIQVTISGSNLGSGADITSVTLVGRAAQILSQNATAVVVRVAAAQSEATGAVLVNSASLGVTTRDNAFAYAIRTL